MERHEIAALAAAEGITPAVMLEELVEAKWRTTIRAMAQGGLSVRQACVATNTDIPPPAVTGSKYWQALYDQELYDWREGMDISRRDIITGMQEAIALAITVEDPGAAIKGWAELGKLCGLYRPQKTEVKVDFTDTTALAQLQRMSDADLMRLMGRTPVEAINGEVLSSTETPTESAP